MALFAKPQADDGVERMVRINYRDPYGMADLQAIVEGPARPRAIMLPKVKSPDELRALDELFDEHDVDIRLHAIIETNHGLKRPMRLLRQARASMRCSSAASIWANSREWGMEHLALRALGSYMRRGPGSM